jgi:AAA15 family ATPase/GTPase
MSQPIPFIRRVRIKNYKSIAVCDVSLGPLTVLLGLNAAGKSNFLTRIAPVVVHSQPRRVAFRLA